MASNNRGPGRTLPASDSTNDRQVPTFNSSGTYGLAIRDNGARRTVTTNIAYTAASGDIVLVDTTSAGVSITLPTPVAGVDQASVTVVRIAGSNDVTVVGTIDGSTNATISSSHAPKSYNTDGTNYFTVA